ncbi:MAG: CDP-diacylglycerol--serine O-phosphatidyltransferase [Bacteroidales bacterium]|jgi:CDP-diacylglycerol--serine O-phosphatidyltransferase|nr:CDP-diacylglycerol--serine O-phosphatidyltransferase [Bacteroidales bacterium]
MKKHIPNFITSLNLASGFIAVIFAFNGEIVTASWLILAAMIFDFLDGLSARLLKAYSDIGKELDSLADLVSFGVAPAVIIYELLTDSSGTIPAFITLFPVIMPVCAALRLAKFNIDTTQITSFKGLPTPANALAVISLIIAGNYSDNKIVNAFTGSAAALIIFTIIISLLMVTRIPLLSLKTSQLKFKGNEGRYILIASAVIVLAIFGIAGASLIVPLYIIVSLISLLFRKSLLESR